MRKKILALLLALMTCVCLTVPAFAAGELTPYTGGFNKNKHDNGGGGRVRTNFYREGDYYVVVEYNGYNLLVEYYNDDFELVSARKIPYENLGRSADTGWGGFYCGENYNFIVTGGANKAEDNSKAVALVTKYDKNWNKLGSVSLLGANTTEAFTGGSVRFAEYNGMLYIHTCHEMYKYSDGVNHQANMTFCVRESDMTITDGRYGISNNSTGYVSHSFDQYIMIDQDHNILTLDKGDAHPRGAALMRYSNKAGSDKFTGSCEMVTLQDAPSGSPLVAPGGLAETPDYYVTTYRYKVPGESVESAYVAFTPKNNFTLEATKKIRLADIEPRSATTPVVAPVDLNSGYIIWTDGEYENIFYVSYTADGTISEVKTAKGHIPDFVPISYNGKLIWYIVSYSAPTFYTLDASGVTSKPAGIYRATTIDFSDVKQGDSYYEPVRWAIDKKIANGTSATTFSPEKNCTVGQVLTFLWKANGSPEPAGSNSFTDVSSNQYYYKPALWAKEKGIVSGSTLNAGASCTRGSAVMYLWKLAGKPAPEGPYAVFGDISGEMADAVAWAVSKGFTYRSSIFEFGTEQPCTRSQIVTFLYNVYAK
ncbi:MAG: S-layer homology domain-containing protein [Oscillospiraceae bacterium]|nr:S-layer homology domain-containing protein [Oscillospiraceae bacterium]